MDTTDNLRTTGAAQIRRREILFVLIVIGVSLRLLLISRQSFWYDEAVAAELARHSASELLSGRAGDNGNPPLYWILLHIWSSVAGTSDGALRTLSALFGVLCIPLVYAIGRQLATDKIALLATALFAVTPYHVYLSQEARAYSMFVFLGMLSAFSLLRALEQPHLWRRWMLYAFATCAMLYAHYYGFFMVAAECAFILVHPNRGPTVLRRVLASFGFVALGFLPWLPSFLRQLHTPGNLSRYTHTWWLHAVATPFVFGLGRTLVWKQDVSQFRVMVAALGGLAILMVLAAGLWTASTRRAPRGIFLHLWLGINLGIPWLVSALLSRLYAERYGALASIPYYFFLAYGFCALRPKLSTACLVTIGAAMFASNAFYFTSVVKTDWRGAVLYVEQHSTQGDLLLFDADFNETSYARYATLTDRRLRVLSSPTSNRLLATDHVGGQITDVAQEVLQHSRVWLVLSDAESGSAQRYQKIFSSWTWSNEVVFRGIRVWLLQHTVRDAAGQTGEAHPYVVFLSAALLTETQGQYGGNA